MSVNLSPVGGVAGQFFDNNGDPLVGGKLFTYAAGTTTPQVTYTSATGTTPNSNPIILNAGGRVPAEIWLTDGLEYKFVLYSSTDQLIGSWDNIIGINSNFVNFTTAEEVQTATAGQTVFTLTTMQYAPNTNNLVVYVDGVNQIEGGSYSFVETDATTVTFNAGLHEGALVKFVSAEVLSTGVVNAANVIYNPAGSGAVATNVQAKLRETVSVKDFGAVGDGVTDDTAAIQAAITFAQTQDLDLDFGGQTYAIKVFGANVSNRLMLRNGKLVSIDTTDQQYLIRIRTTDNIYVENMEFDGNQRAAKLLFINTNATACRAVINNCVFRNALQTDVATSTASGVQIQPEDGNDYFVSTKITNSSFYNITSTRANPLGEALVSVGRGITIFDCQDTVITNCDFDEIGPYWDGDAIAVGANGSIAGRRENFSLLVSNCWFRDCEKRSIKSQVSRSIVDTVVCERTQAFTYFGGQTEIDLQYGGRVNNVICKYATGAAPRDIIGVAANSTPLLAPFEVSNISILSESAADVIEHPVSFIVGAADSVLPLATVTNLHVNCKVKSICRLRTSDQTLAETTFEKVVLRDIEVADFDTGDAEHAIIFMNRGSLSYNWANLYLYNVRATSGYIPPTGYLDPAPGSTAFYNLVSVENFNTPATPAGFLEYVAPIKTYRHIVAEDGVFSKTFNLSTSSSAVIITLTYTSARDSSLNKLVTQGVIQSSLARTYYTELIAGRKSSAQTGAISIDESTTDNTFTVSKTAGSTSATGFLLITIQDVGYIA